MITRKNLKENLRPNRQIPGPAIIPIPLQVEVRSGSSEDFDHASKAFKSLVQKEKVVSLYKEKQSYEKPSDKKRRKLREAYEKRLALEAKMKLIRSGEWDKRMQKKARRKEYNGKSTD